MLLRKAVVHMAMSGLMDRDHRLEQEGGGGADAWRPHAQGGC